MLLIPGDFGFMCVESLVLAAVWTRISLPSLGGTSVGGRNAVTGNI
jgi:hypothetical protein